ncbi:MAG TPA: alginate lyase family protein [Bryobacteraceae bacterium]
MRIAFSFILAAMCAQAAGVPKTLVSEDETEPIHSAIVRKEAWTQDAVKRLRAEADRRLREGPWSVTTDRPEGVTVDLHDYYSEAPYWWPDPQNPDGPYIRKDGQANPDRFLSNKAALNAMCDAVFTLGTAAYLLDDARYGQRAARIVNMWFVNPATRMNPNLEYSQAIRGVNDGRGAGIIDGRVLIRALQGIDFLAQTGAWNAKDQAAVHKWFEEYLHWLTTSKKGEDEKHAGNNHASWWTAQVAAAAAFVGNTAAGELAFNYYRDRIFPRQIRADGSAPREESRTRSLWYSAFNLEAYTMICRIARVHGVDLWSVKSKNGATIATVIDYLTPFLSDPKKWPREQISDFNNESPYFLAFAGMGLKKPEYVALFRKLEKPEGAWLSFVDLLVGRWEAAAHQTRH